MPRLVGKQALGKISGVRPLNFSKEVRALFDRYLPKRIVIDDITLREGRQVEGIVLSVDECCRIATQLVDVLKVPMIQIGYWSRYDYDVIKAIGKLKLKVDTEVMTIPHQQPPFTKKAVWDALDRIMECGLGIVTPYAVSNDHLIGLARLRGHADKGIDYAKDLELEIAVESIKYVKRQGGTININLQDYMGCDIDYLQRFCRETAAAGVNIIELDDIAGPCHPATYYYCARKVREAAPNTPAGIHVHNDFALGLAGVMGAIEAGVEVVTCGMLGLGERAGHCATEQIVIICEFLYGLNTGLQLDKMVETARLVADLMRQPIPKNWPVVGENAYSHLHDWHWQFPDDVWAVCALRPEVVGNKENVLIGEWSGPYGLMNKAKQLGFKLPFEKTGEVLAAARDWMRWHKRPVNDDEFTGLLKVILEPKAKKAK